VELISNDDDDDVDEVTSNHFGRLVYTRADSFCLIVHVDATEYFNLIAYCIQICREASGKLEQVLPILRRTIE